MRHHDLPSGRRDACDGSAAYRAERRMVSAVSSSRVPPQGDDDAGHG